MDRINILDENTSNKIAAGEVVERASSVVKELLENSIDAKAKNITIQIEEGGETLIKIIDDGVGIHPDDIKTAFIPHATSKISVIEDIYNINTLGFRGEALASIAAISKVRLSSRIASNDFGVEIFVSCGKIESIKEVGCNVGTTIEVRDIFYNVPARKKFLKSKTRETSLISEIVSKIALSNPEISFSYYNNNKKSLTTYGTSNQLDSIRSIYGKTIADNSIYFENHKDTLSVYGYIGTEEISRKSRSNQSIFINKRFIKNRTITTAVENAYRSFLTINKHPFFIVFIDIFPEYIDVNIHPTKAEIKFKDERIIYSSVFNAVHNKLKDHLEGSFYLPEEKNKPSIYEGSPYEKINFLKENSNFVQNSSEPKSNDYKYGHDDLPSIQKDAFNDTKGSVNQDDVMLNKEDITVGTIDIPVDLKSHDLSRSEIQLDEDSFKKDKLPPLNVIGQYNKTYILAEYDHTLYIVDQHAAHEKIFFEKYKKEIVNSNVIIQSLLTPCILELNYEDFGYYIENKELFLKSGFHIEEFGENTLYIREVPYILGKLDVKNTFLSILDDIKNFGTGSTDVVKYNRIATMACKSAIKGNDKLSLDEMKSLLKELSTIEEPFTCPHGRPTIIKFTNYELEKKFKRVQ